MELRQLAYFVAVAEEHNFTRAAERIPIAQPAISQRIRRLEAELGEHLFVRDRRGARLTPAGQALLPHAPTTLRAADGGREAVAALSGLLAGRGQVPLRALRAEPMVTLTRASKLRTTLETACQAAGFCSPHRRRDQRSWRDGRAGGREGRRRGPARDRTEDSHQRPARPLRRQLGGRVGPGRVRYRLAKR